MKPTYFRLIIGICLMAYLLQAPSHPLLSKLIPQLMADSLSAQQHLKQGLAAYLGQGSGYDLVSARQHFQAASDLGLPRASALLAEMLYTGHRGYYIDRKASVALLLKASQAGDLYAKFSLSKMKAKKLSATREFPMIINDGELELSQMAPNLKKEADQNDPLMQYAYSVAIGIVDQENNKSESIEYRDKAAQQGVLLAKLNAATSLYWEDKGHPTPVIEQFNRLAVVGVTLAEISSYALTLIADKNVTGDLNSNARRTFHYEAAPSRELGKHLIFGPQAKAQAQLAFYLFNLAAEEGDEMAMAFAGHMLLHGKGVPQDSNIGLPYLLQTESSNVPLALYYLAQEYFSGQFVKRDDVKAYQLLERANKIFTSDALIMLMAEISLHGNIASTSPDQGLKILEKFANDGNVEAMCILCNIYKVGCGIKKDLTKSQYWYQKVKPNQP